MLNLSLFEKKGREVNMKIIIWGCGTIGKRVYRPLIEGHNAQIVAYTDSCEKILGGEKIQYIIRP